MEIFTKGDKEMISINTFFIVKDYYEVFDHEKHIQRVKRFILLAADNRPDLLIVGEQKTDQELLKKASTIFPNILEKEIIGVGILHKGNIDWNNSNYPVKISNDQERITRALGIKS